MPFDLTFVPNPALRDLWPETRELDGNGDEVPFWKQLQKIPSGSILFSVMAKSEPDGFAKSSTQHIANVRLTSDLIESAFGDDRLYFRHGDKDKDFKGKKEWEKHVEQLPKNQKFGKTKVPDIWP